MFATISPLLSHRLARDQAPLSAAAQCPRPPCAELMVAVPQLEVGGVKLVTN